MNEKILSHEAYASPGQSPPGISDVLALASRISFMFCAIFPVLRHKNTGSSVVPERLIYFVSFRLRYLVVQGVDTPDVRVSRDYGSVHSRK